MDHFRGDCPPYGLARPSARPPSGPSRGPFPGPFGLPFARPFAGPFRFSLAVPLEVPFADSLRRAFAVPFADPFQRPRLGPSRRTFHGPLSGPEKPPLRPTPTFLLLSSRFLVLGGSIHLDSYPQTTQISGGVHLRSPAVPFPPDSRSFACIRGSLLSVSASTSVHQRFDSSCSEPQSVQPVKSVDRLSRAARVASSA